VKPVPEPRDAIFSNDSDILDLAILVDRHPGSSRSYLFESSYADWGVTDRTVKRRLSQAVEYGWIRRDGEGRATRYYPTDEFRHVMAMRYIALPQKERPKQE